MFLDAREIPPIYISQACSFVGVGYYQFVFQLFLNPRWYTSQSWHWFRTYSRSCRRRCCCIFLLRFLWWRWRGWWSSFCWCIWSSLILLSFGRWRLQVQIFYIIMEVSPWYERYVAFVGKIFCLPVRPPCLIRLDDTVFDFVSVVWS